jgi:ankyrin repeat protein
MSSKSHWLIISQEDLVHGVSGLRKRKRGVDDIDESGERTQPSAIPNDSYLSSPNLSSSHSAGEKRLPMSSTKTSFDSARKARTKLTNKESFNHLFNELLHRAVMEGDIVMAQRLLAGGADVSAVDKDGDTSLFIAAREAHQTVVQLLLDHGAEVTTPNRNECATPLHISAILGRKAITQQLLGHCASLPELLSAGNTDQDTALHLAVWGDHKSTVELLVQHGADVNSTNKNLETPLHFAAKVGSLAIAKLLLKEGAV